MAPCRQSCCCYSNKYHDVFGSTMPNKEFYSMKGIFCYGPDIDAAKAKYTLSEALLMNYILLL